MQDRTASIEQGFIARAVWTSPHEDLRGPLPPGRPGADGTRGAADRDGEASGPAPEADPAAEVRLWWPGAHIWYGRATRSWWAFLPGHPDRLLSFLDPAELVRTVAVLRKNTAPAFL